MALTIRQTADADRESILNIVRPVLASGETYAIDRHLDDADIAAYWFMPAHEVFVAQDDGAIVGTYYLMANQGGGGAHVANCGYMTAQAAQGRGVARAMCLHSLNRAKNLGFKAMQFNHVVSTNIRAVALWHSLGFETVGILPKAFNHPEHGFVDSFVMFRTL